MEIVRNGGSSGAKMMDRMGNEFISSLQLDVANNFVLILGGIIVGKI